LNIRAAIAALTVSTILIVTKTIAYQDSGSVAVLGSLIDSVMDLLVSVVSFAAIRLSLIPADDDHRFGHGKAEALAGVVQAVVITISALLLIFESIKKFIEPAKIKNPDQGIMVMVLAIVLTLGLVLYQKYVIKKTGSIAIEADNLHYKGDLVMNALVIVALYMGSTLELVYADPIFGFLVGGYLIYNVLQLGIKSVDILMDKEMSDLMRDQITALVFSVPQVQSIEEIRTRTNGKDSFIQFHLKLDGHMSLNEAHNITDEIEEKVMEKFKNTEIIIHPEPV
jgi:ferrous-iron efflux pump FieF